MNYLEKLPDELLYIITEQLVNLIKAPQNDKLDISLINLSERYKKIYDQYIKDVQNGWVFNFTLHKITQVEVRYAKNSHHQSTSSYFGPTYKGYDLHNSFNFNKLFVTSDNSNFIIYYHSNYVDIIFETYIYIVKKDNKILYKLLEVENDFIVDHYTRISSKNIYESNNWKNIWDKLSLEDQNAILYQNGFPTK